MSHELTRTRWWSVPCNDLPDGTILFDGVCVLCSAWFGFVAARDPAARFRFAAIQDPIGRAIAGRLGFDLDAPESNAVVVGGRAYFRSDAAIEVLRRLPGFRWVSLLLAIPRPLRDGLYNWVARHRYALFGRLDTCLVPSPELRKHLLTEAPREAE